MQKNKLLFNVLAFLSPVVLMVVTTSIMDLLSYFWLRKRDSKSFETFRGCLKDDIPLRATAISMILHAVFTIIFAYIFAQKVTPIEKYLIVNVLIKIDNMLEDVQAALDKMQLDDVVVEVLELADKRRG